MKTYLSFCHDYYKLLNPAFTTIRGAAAAKQYRLDQEVDCLRVEPGDGFGSGGKGVLLFRATIVGVAVKPLADIPLEVLQRDASYKSFCPRSHEEFMGLLNSMRKAGKMGSIEDSVTVLQLFKI